MKTIVLASSSPRRKEIMDLMRVDYVVDPSNYEEDMTLPLPPHELAMHLALGKARDVARRHKHAVIIGADSMVIFEGKVYGKPHTPERAREMLHMLQSKKNTIVSGMAVIDTDSGKIIIDYTLTDIYMLPMNESEIEAYVTTEEPLAKAGAYATSGFGAMFIKKTEGDPTGGGGLSLPLVVKYLKRFGVDILKFA